MKRRTTGSEDGIVAVETALVIPTLMLVVALAVTLVMTMGAKMSVLDASREAARLAARGESTSAAVAAGRRLAPSRSTVRLVDRDHWVQAVVSAEIRPFRALPGFTVSASTLAEREDR
ncbi:MAG TPA: TadE family type IV pilus minor pilin [Mycobacteriales bacterium]|nr:TadE family type IV pilus minor pilin [Mycobacteriales bacterium]